MSNETLHRLMDLLLYTMQASVLVPVAVVWWRKRHFSSPVRLLSWYVYLSIGAVIGARVCYTYPTYFSTNYGFLIGFNVGKMVLFAAVYRQVIAAAKLRRGLMVATAATLLGVLGVVASDFHLAVAVSRVAQCALLAGFALVYLEQTLSRRTPGANLQDPLWLLSIGQLLYSAGTATAFSLDHLSITRYDQSWKYIFVAISGLVFNYFLTLAFWRARRGTREAAPSLSSTGSQLVSS